MKNIIVTAGDLYTDIDVLACAVGYGELLSIQGIKSQVVLPGPFNKSITSKISSWPIVFDKSPSNVTESSFVIVDISEPDHIAKFVDQDKIIKIFDHHYGFEKYWNDKYGSDACIEKVGACATQIWEEYLNSGNSSKISKISANLLISAILSNTLNFKAFVTSQRDIDAFSQLKAYSDLPDNWVEIYFKDQEIFTYKNPYQSVKEDTISITTRLPYKLVIGQLELWNSSNYFENHLEEAIRALKDFGEEHWFLTSPSISEGKNYIYCENIELQEELKKMLEIDFRNNIAVTNKLILRKEIKKMLT